MNKSGLHPVYPSGAQAAKEVSKTADSVKDEWAAHATDSDAAWEKQLSAARSEATHWKKEAERVKFITNDALEDAKRLKSEKKELKLDLEDARKELDGWKQRYNEMAASHGEAKIYHVITAKEAAGAKASLQKAQKALEDLQLRQDRTQKALEERLDRTQKALEEHQKRLKSVDEERPEIVEKLQVGGMAFREVKLLKAAVAQAKGECAKLQARIKELELHHASSNEKLRAAEEGKGELAAIKDRLRAAEVAKGELAATKDKLRASSVEAMSLASKMQGCTAMLVRTEQVLRACSELHVGKEGGGSLASALKETSANVAAFLASLKP